MTSFPGMFFFPPVFFIFIFLNLSEKVTISRLNLTTSVNVASVMRTMSHVKMYDCHFNAGFYFIFIFSLVVVLKELRIFNEKRNGSAVRFT